MINCIDLTYGRRREIEIVLEGRTISYDIAGEVLLPVILIAGLLLLPLNFIHFGIASPAHIWAAIVLPVVLITGRLRITIVEIVVFFLFITVAVFITVATDYDRVKEVEQIFKFYCVYPGFFLIGRALGLRYIDRPLPFGWTAVLILIMLEYCIQYFEVPGLYEEVDFMQNAIHGSFLERNWFAIYFFFLTYLLFIKEGADITRMIVFTAICVAVTLLSESKVMMVACGIAVMLQTRGSAYAPYVKLGVLVIGTVFYVFQFSDELSGPLLQVRLEEERGLAFAQSVELIGENGFGYGLGFVESYFANLSIVPRGLGLGVNSVFSTPLDLMIIGGVFGALFWAVFFAGIGIGGMRVLAPVAAWSLLNPLHQSEMVYFFIGFIVSSRGKTSDRRYDPA